MRAFLKERPSIGLSLFRPALAWTVGAHVIPSLFQLSDNYLHSGFKLKNGSFFPLSILGFVEASPDWVVRLVAILFIFSTVAFGLGYKTRLSCALMTLGCYYFYALNSLHIGTLSYDILLVTLTLVCLFNYTGDAFSLDQFRRGDVAGFWRLRPFFVQRLLQVQLTGIFWGTALAKFTVGGNWLTDNPYYALMHYPQQGVVRDFPLRSFLATQPDLCHSLGLCLIVFEFLVSLSWWFGRTRWLGIALGTAFQIMLWLTLHVPTIFLFLFPAMMLFFVPPEEWLAWIEQRRSYQASRGRAVLLYDGHCGFCKESVKRLQVLDLFGYIDLRDYHTVANLAAIHPSLSLARLESEMVLVEPDGRVSGGFDAFRRLCLRLAFLAPLAPFVHLPGAKAIGGRAYRWVATHRYLFLPRANHCAVGGSGGAAGSSSTKT